MKVRNSGCAKRECGRDSWLEPKLKRRDACLFLVLRCSLALINISCVRVDCYLSYRGWLWLVFGLIFMCLYFKTLVWGLPRELKTAGPPTSVLICHEHVLPLQAPESTSSVKWVGSENGSGPLAQTRCDLVNYSLLLPRTVQKSVCNGLRRRLWIHSFIQSSI